MLLVGLTSPTVEKRLASIIESVDSTWRFRNAHDLAETEDLLSAPNVGAALLETAAADGISTDSLLRIRKRFPDIPIIIIGPHGNLAEHRSWLRTGATDHLPIDRLDQYSVSRAIDTAIAKKVSEEKLHKELERARITLKSIGDAVVTTDVAGNITYLNPAAERISGWSTAEAIEKPFGDVLRIVDAATRSIPANPVKKAVELDKTVYLPADSLLIKRDGTLLSIEDSAAPIRSRNGATSGAVMVFRDTSKSRELSERLVYLAHHDTLTGLPNRALFIERLQQAVALACRHARRLAVLFVDIDSFKHINDSMGHAAGDSVLMEIGRRLIASVRSVDSVCRVGGDEYVVLLSEVRDDYDVTRMAEKLREAVAMPYPPLSSGLTLAVSIGVSVYPEDGLDAETLLKNADTAMYHAKHAGRNGWARFSIEMAQRAQRRASLKEALIEGVRSDEFLLHYQPLINIQDGAIAGAEALIRWRHPKEGVIPPGQFISIAEESGAINHLGQWTLREACQQACTWVGLQPTFDRMCVNVSAVELATPGFAQKVALILEETKLEPRHLELEVTETAAMHDVSTAREAFAALASLGVRFAIDDFGTGYSSLRRLLELPFKTLKIDMSFVQAVHKSADAWNIVNAVVGIGKTMGLCVVAEGVETTEQLRLLESINCDVVQGYLFSAPIEAAKFEVLLRQRRRKLLQIGKQTQMLR